MALSKELTDVQAEEDTRGIPLAQAGVTKLQIPMTVRDKVSMTQRIVATLKLAARLDKTQRGVHMSRFLEGLTQYYEKELSLDVLQDLAVTLAELQNSRYAYAEASFTYFIWVQAPESKIKSRIPVEVTLQADSMSMKILEVKTPVINVCPCSLEISEKGQAHNQRGYVTISITPTDWVWIEELAEMSVNAASGPVVPLMKRIDEKWITDFAHENPRFVEDVVREVVLKLRPDPRNIWFEVVVENEESIHAHNAYAYFNSAQEPDYMEETAKEE